MSAEDFFYCAPGRLKVLVVPLGKVRTSLFSGVLQFFHENTTVPFKGLDVERCENAMFNPATFPQGQLMFECLTSWDPSYAYLEDLQPWRKLYAVIGIMDEQVKDSIEDHDEELEKLRTKYKAALVHRLFALGGDNTPLSTSIQPLLNDLSIRIILSISDMGQAIQGLPTVRSPTDPSLGTSTTNGSPEMKRPEKRPASVGPGGLQRTPSGSSVIKPSNRNSIMTSQNASSESLGEKRGTSKGRGRVLKVLGGLSALCGVLPNAVTLYSQCVEILRLTTDYVWHASALEGVGMALVLMRYLKVEYTIPSILQPNVSAAANYSEPGKISRTESPAPPDISTDPFPTQSLLDVLAETHTQILHLYQRSQTIFSSEPVPPICFSDNIVRFARLLCDVYATGSLGEETLQANVLGTPVTPSPTLRNAYPPRGEIARWAMRAWGPHLEHDSVPLTYRIRVIAALSHIMGIIGFYRRRAGLLSELLRIAVPQLVHARVLGAAEWGLHPNAAQNLVQPGTDDDGLVELMKSLMQIYGAVVPDDDRPISGWGTLRAEVLKSCIAFCEALAHPAGVLYFTSLLFSVARDTVEKDEQIRLAGNLPRLVVAARKKGVTLEADYWDPFVVQSIEVLKATEIELRQSSVPNRSSQGSERSTPFLFEARRGPTTSEKQNTWFVQDEEVLVNVVLRNDLDFNLEVTSLELWTEGVAVDMSPSSFVLPAQSLHTHTTSFKPLEPGKLHIKGCDIKFSACKAGRFSVLGSRSGRDREKWYDSRGGEGKVKAFGKVSRKAYHEGGLPNGSSEEESFWPPIVLSATVLPHQPVLVVERNSLQDGSITLLEGEIKSINIRLRNVSPSRVNHLQVRFADSTSPVLGEALSGTAISEEEGSELEYFLHERPAFVWLDHKDPIDIAPGGPGDINVRVHGNRGLTRGTIIIEYGYIDPSSNENTSHCRNIDIDVAVTVNASLELLSFDFAPSLNDVFSIEESTEAKSHEFDKFLLILEIRNSWINPLTLFLQSSPSEEAPYAISEVLQSSQTRRLVVLFPRIFIPPEKAQLPLPRKTKDTQYIVPSEINRQSILTVREAWWYRQAILDCLQVTWSEQGFGARAGSVEMRGIKLNERHLRIVRRDPVEVRLQVTALRSPFDNIISRRLVVNIDNQQGTDMARPLLTLVSSLTCYLRLTVIPKGDPIEVSKAICIDGMDQSPAMRIESHGSKSWATDFTILTKGSFGIGVVVEEKGKGEIDHPRRWASNICNITNN